MSPVQVTDLDLRLLRVLDALLESGEVGRAADLLDVTPSAVSHSLRQLRARFGDSLLVRSRGRLQPTALAVALKPQVRAGLALLAGVLAKEAVFDPGRSVRILSLAAPDYPLVCMLPAVVAELRRRAPGIDLRLRALGPDVFEALATSLDLVMAGAEVEGSLALDRDLMRSRVVTERFRCVLHPDNSAAKAPRLDLETYLAASHILVSTAGGDTGIADDALARQGRRRRVAVTVPSFMAALAYASSSDLIATLPEAIALQGARSGSVVMRQPPIELPSSDAYLRWHPRMQDDPGHAWWRGTLTEALAPFREPGPRS